MIFYTFLEPLGAHLQITPRHYCAGFVQGIERRACGFLCFCHIVYMLLNQGMQILIIQAQAEGISHLYNQISRDLYCVTSRPWAGWAFPGHCLAALGWARRSRGTASCVGTTFPRHCLVACGTWLGEEFPRHCFASRLRWARRSWDTVAQPLAGRGVPEALSRLAAQALHRGPGLGEAFLRHCIAALDLLVDRSFS